MDGDLINRAEALKAIDKLYLDGKFGIYNDGSEIFVKCHNAISNVPTVDAEPVRHGKCELCGRGKPIKAFTVLPECGLQYGPSIMARYCPNCGGRMDGEAKDDG